MPTRLATRLLAGLLLLAFVAFAARVLPPVLGNLQGGYLAFNDFFAQWSFARFALADDPTQIYDTTALHQLQLSLEPRLHQFLPFPYPPTYLFVVLPLGWLPFGPAYMAWETASLALFLWAVLGGAWRTPLVAFILLAPVTVIAVIYGQSSLLASALIVGGMRILRSRPMISGILLGLATFKPQLGVLIPLALIAGGYWRTLAMAGASVGVLVIASGVAFGWDMWSAWPRAIAAHLNFAESAVNDYHKPGILATLKLAGMALPVARAVQGGVTVAVAAVVWFCFRRGVTDLSIAVLQVGTFLATPYLFRYDMPMLANAILLFVRQRKQEAGGLGAIDTLAVVTGLLFPALTMLTTRFFYFNSIVLVLLFSVIARRRLAPRTL